MEKNQIPGNANMNFLALLKIHVANVVGFPGFKLVRPKCIFASKSVLMICFNKSFSPIETPPVVMIISASDNPRFILSKIWFILSFAIPRSIASIDCCFNNDKIVVRFESQTEPSGNSSPGFIICNKLIISKNLLIQYEKWDLTSSPVESTATTGFLNTGTSLTPTAASNPSSMGPNSLKRFNIGFPSTLMSQPIGLISWPIFGDFSMRTTASSPSYKETEIK